MTTLRAMPESTEAETVALIDRRLDGIEASDGVTIRWAIESGSRAWGFPSPDSDYDCRFLYVRHRRLHAMAAPRSNRDPPRQGLRRQRLDLAKALRLLVKGNGTLTEWLRSPIVYGVTRCSATNSLPSPNG